MDISKKWDIKTLINLIQVGKHILQNYYFAGGILLGV